MWPQHKTSRLNLILILSLSLWDYYPETAQKPVAMTTCSSSEHQWDEEPIIILPCYLSSQWVEYGAVKSAERCSSVGDHCEVTGLWRGEREEKRWPRTLCFCSSCSSHTGECAWLCLMPARPCQLSPLDVETSRARPRAQHSSHFHLSSLAGRCHKNQILSQDF